MSTNVEVVAKPGEPVEKLIKRFSRKVTKEKIMEKVRGNLYFTKRSDKKRAEKVRATYFHKKEEEKRRKKGFL